MNDSDVYTFTAPFHEQTLLPAYPLNLPYPNPVPTNHKQLGGRCN